MLPTDDQIRLAAYHRWQRRGHAHGHHDADWLAAEQDLLLALNYRLAARHTADATSAAPPTASARPVCRFCEQAEPRTTFAPPRPALPATLGLPGPHVADVCQSCREPFDASLAAPLAWLVAAASTGTLPETVPTPAYKGLVHAALTMLPTDLLDLFPDAIDWVANPEDDPLDAEIARRGLLVHRLERRQRPWSAIAVKSDPDAPMPHVLAFLGTESATIEIPLPMCLRDEDLDGETLAEPEVPTVDGLIHDVGPHTTRRLRVARNASPRTGRLLRLDLP